MFFLLSKLLIVLLRPLCWILGLGIWALLTGNEIRRKRLIWVMVALTFLSSNKILVNELARMWEVEPAKNARAASGVAVILGGYAEWDAHRNRVQMSDAAERLYVPIRLYQQGKINKFILSGGSSSVTGRTKPEATYVKPILLEFGIPDSAIVVEDKSRNTHENALNTASILKKMNIKDEVLLVTSAFHMRRAQAVFSKAGIQVNPFPVHYISDYGRGYFLPDWFIPSSEALFRFDMLIKEFVGYAVYSLTGKL
jgi:uncharacterized SAM-binding protein YcdF (DUF218 family)